MDHGLKKQQKEGNRKWPLKSFVKAFGSFGILIVPFEWGDAFLKDPAQPEITLQGTHVQSSRFHRDTGEGIFLQSGFNGAPLAVFEEFASLLVSAAHRYRDEFSSEGASACNHDANAALL